MRPELEAACLPYTLVLPGTPLRGLAGLRLGRGTGSSLEFQEFRAYVPGDDLRHVDWRAYARTDQLQVRQYREEIAPVVDLVADLSPSMAVTKAKASAARDLVEAFAFWAGVAGSRARRWCAAGEFADADQAAFTDAADPAALLRLPLRPRSLRVLLSDFLFPQDPARLITALAGQASGLWVVQLLDPWEQAPDAAAALTLVDAETGERREIHLSERTRRGYLERLERLCQGVEAAARTVAASFARVVAAPPGALFRDQLLPQGLLAPA